MNEDISIQRSRTTDTPFSMVDALTSGEEEKFEEGFRQFCTLYHQHIRRWCQKWFSQQADADDAAQELLVKLRDKLKQYTPQAKTRFRNWLSKVSKNAAISIHRKSKKREFQHEAPEDFGPEDSDFVFRIFVDFERRNLVEGIVKKSRAHLTERDREVFDSYLQSEPATDTEERMKVSLNAVHQAMHRVRQRVKGAVLNEVNKQSNLELEDLFDV